MFVFGCEQGGRLDHLDLYRPGSGICTILKNQDGAFSTAYQGVGIGIESYNLRSPDGRAFDFDNDQSEQLDHIAFYRPGIGIFWVIQNNGHGTFSPFCHQGSAGLEIAGYDLKSVDDVAFVFYYDPTGKMDHTVL